MALLPNDWPASAELSEFEAICDTEDVYFVSVREVLHKVVRVCVMNWRWTELEFVLCDVCRLFKHGEEVIYLLGYLHWW